MLSLAGSGPPGPSTGRLERLVRPPGAVMGLGAGDGVLAAMGVPIVGLFGVLGVTELCELVEPVGTVLMVPGSSLREVVG